MQQNSEMPRHQAPESARDVYRRPFPPFAGGSWGQDYNVPRLFPLLGVGFGDETNRLYDCAILIVMLSLFSVPARVPSNEEQLDLCKKALKEKETVDQIIMQGVFVGFPHSGKTSTKKRLMGKRPNRQQASTGVAEKASRVEIEKTTVQSLSSVNWHEIDDLDEETAVITDDIDNFEFQKEKARMDFVKHKINYET